MERGGELRGDSSHPSAHHYSSQCAPKTFVTASHYTMNSMRAKSGASGLVPALSPAPRVVAGTW